MMKEGEKQEDRGPLDLTRQLEELQARIKELDNSLAIALEINEEHQRLNGKLQMRLTEVEENNKKLSTRIEDQVDRSRKAGL